MAIASPISVTMFVTYSAMLPRCAITHTSPSVVGSVTNANANGTTTAPSVPNMNSRTRRAIGTAIDSPLPRSLLYTGWRSWLSAGKPVRNVCAPGTVPIAARICEVWFLASAACSGVAICT